MSRVFTDRLKGVQREYVAALDSLNYVVENWERQTIYFSVTTPRLCGAALRNLETVFTIRLFSVFEGVLKERLATNHSHLRLIQEPRVVYLIDRVANLQNPHIDSPLRMKVHSVREYRNYLVHSGGKTVLPVTFSESLARLTRFVDKLPDPPK